SLGSRPVPARATAAEIVKELGTELPDGPTPADEVIDLLGTACEPGLIATPSGRFFGFVIGATMSIFTGLAAARDAVLRRVGWDVAANGLSGSPRVRVVVGAQRHDT